MVDFGFNETNQPTQFLRWLIGFAQKWAKAYSPILANTTKLCFSENTKKLPVKVGRIFD